MVEYKCDKCNKIFNKKSNFTKHINRKNKCKSKEIVNIQNIPENTQNIPEIYPKLSDNKETKMKCSYCDKIFVYKSGLYRHTKLRCKVKKEKNYDKLVREIAELKEEINKIKSKITII